MHDNKAIKAQKPFLRTWLVLNLIGLVVGIFLLSLIMLNLEYAVKYSAFKTMLIWSTLGASIGAFQWFMLRRLGIDFFKWVSLTALGCGLLVALYSWVFIVASFELRIRYAVPYSIINIGLGLTLPIGGAIIGSLQSIVIRKHTSRLDLWIRSYIVGLLLPPIITHLSFLIKSFLLNLLYSFLDIVDSIDLSFMIDLRWLIFIGFLMIITVIFISILTGNILLKHTNINSGTMNTS